nr:MAG TPA: tail protein [Caudoviricetes sp.]
MPTTTEDRLLEEAQLELSLPNGAKRTILPLEGSYERKAIMEIALLTIKWTTENFVKFPIGTRTTYRGTTYTLHTEPKVKKVHSRLYEYDITLEAPEADLARLKFKFPADGRLQFSLTAKPQEFIQYIVDNLNERGTQRWQGLTSLPADTSEKTLTFNHNTLIEALKSVCEAFKTEWSAEAGVLTLGAVEFEKQSPITLAYGKGKGLLPGLVRTDNGKVAPLGRMYVQTTTRNIPESYQRKTLKLASGTWHFNGTTFTNAPTADSTAYNTTENYVELANKAVISAEASTEISDIYPKRVGVVSQVFKLERATRKTANGKDSATSILFDFTDTTNEVDYKAHIIKGETAKLIFQSGACAGREFEFQYKHEEKRFLLVPLSADDSIFPSETFPIAVGDKYAVFGIELPNQYITAAETEAAKAAVATLHKQAQDRISITAEVQSLWLKKQTDPTIARKLRIGGFVSFQDPALSPKPYTIRIKAIKRPLTDPEAPTLELSNEPVQTNSISTVIKDVQALKYANSVTNSIIASNAEGQSVDVAALDEKYLSAAAPDVAKGTITFAEGLKALKQAYFAKGLEVGNAVSGLIAGRGAIIDENGNTEVQSLTVRGFLKATEYMLNRIQITEGAQWLTEGGVIEKVAETASQGGQKRYNITFRARFEGDIQAPFKEGDILRGQIAKLQGGAGIETSWLRVEGVNGRKVEVSLYSNQQVPEGRNTAPTEQMRVARWGNTIDATRRSHIVLDPERGQIVRRTNIKAPIIEPQLSDGFSLGTLPSWLKKILGGAVDDKSDYLFARGIITQDIIRYTPEGKPIAERVDRGVWSAQQSYYHEGKNATTGIYEISRVWLDGTLYELAPRGNGSEQPSANNTNWIVVQEKPRNGVDGANGERGRDGARGQDGRNGRDGAKGQDGKNGADGLTPMPNLLKSADFDPKNVSNDTARNEGFAWKASNAEGGVIRHEPNVMPPHAGAKVVSCESFKRSTYWRDNVECYAGIVQNVHIISGVTYTFSVYVKGADAGWLISNPIDGTHFKISGASPIDEGKNTAEGWKRYAVTFTPRSSGDTWIMLRSWSRNQYEAGGKVYFACPKLEESYRPTPWTRAQEDFRGAAVRPLGDWDALPDGFNFQSGGVGEEFIDLVSVKSEGALLWWSCKRSHAKTKDTRPNVNAPFWELGQNLKFVATDLLLAKKAFIENLGVRNVETRNAQGEVTFKAEENGEVRAKGGRFENIHIAGESRFSKLKATNELTGFEAGEISFSPSGLTLKGYAVTLETDVLNCYVKDISDSAWRFTRFIGGNVHVQGSFAAKHRVTAVVTSSTITYYLGGEATVGESETKTVFERKGAIVPANVLEDGNGMKLAINEQIDSTSSLSVDTIVVALDRPETLKITMARTQRVHLINVSGFTITLDLGDGQTYKLGWEQGNSVTLFGLYDLGGKGNKGIWVIH